MKKTKGMNRTAKYWRKLHAGRKLLESLSGIFHVLRLVKVLSWYLIMFIHLLCKCTCCSVHLESVGSPSCFPHSTVLLSRVLRWEQGGFIWLLIVTAASDLFPAPPPFKMPHHEHLPVIKIFFKNKTWMAAWHLSSECPITVCVSDSNCVGLGWMASLKSRAVLGNQGGICTPHSQLREASLPYSVCLDRGLANKVFEK